MAAASVTTHYVSEKISKVRLVAEPLLESERFVTGSWDMTKNFVRVWRIAKNPYVNQNVEHILRCHDKVAIEGDVTGLEFVDDNTIAVGSADGHLSLIDIKRGVEEDQLMRTARSECLHNFNSGVAAPLTAIDVCGRDIATIGEDGRLNVLNAYNLKQVKRTIDADSVSLIAVKFLSADQLFTSNRMGIIRMFDSRAASEGQPNIAFMAASQDEKSSNFVSCMATHPAQQHILICGTEEGSITVWDLRNLAFPASYMSAHSSTINDIGFRPHDATKLFSASEGGELWLWSENKGYNDAHQKDGSCAWLSGERVRSLIDVDGVITKMHKPINTFDIQGTRLVCGSDNEAIYIVDNIC